MKKWRQVAVVMLCLMAAMTMTMTADAKTKKKQPRLSKLNNMLSNSEKRDCL